MKVSLVAAVGIGLVVGMAYAQQEGAPKASPEAGELKQQASYGLGLDLGRRFRAQSLDLDPNSLSQGLRDGLSGGQPKLSDEQIQQAMEAFGQEVNTKRAQSMQVQGEKNKAEGAAYLAANKAKPGVVVLPSGLQYKVLTEGTGPSPKATDTVKTNYRGTLIDGTEFDSSFKRNEPASFRVDQVIPGWTEALQKMKVGSKWQLFVPAALAYGEQAMPGSPIGPSSTLLFEVELLEIE